eukprot:TRINITY_DN41492_c0_g1_i1.p1 TRINITY_DN41492_c0_g1~~TRINITY_DN41492_c0_g1_i1.p1  ORF type:complete len:180 (+),score=2.70 TRINITY_DN41492_c0_g1_i1:196-735(+)
MCWSKSSLELYSLELLRELDTDSNQIIHHAGRLVLFRMPSNPQSPMHVSKEQTSRISFLHAIHQHRNPTPACFIETRNATHDWSNLSDLLEMDTNQLQARLQRAFSGRLQLNHVFRRDSFLRRGGPTLQPNTTLQMLSRTAAAIYNKVSSSPSGINQSATSCNMSTSSTELADVPTTSA